MSDINPTFTKRALIDLFPTISPTAIRMGQDGPEIRGKWAVVTPFYGKWDVWLHNPKNLRKGLSMRKLGYMLRALDVPVEAGLQERDGEAWVTVDSAEKISDIRSVLGVRKKRAMSEATRQRLTEQLQEK